jgi:hypothetical protein
MGKAGFYLVVIVVVVIVVVIAAVVNQLMACTQVALLDTKLLILSALK